MTDMDESEPDKDDKDNKPEPSDEVTAFHRTRRMFAITLVGTLLIAPKRCPDSHQEWLDDLDTSGWLRTSCYESVRGFIHGGNIYAYNGEDFGPLNAKQYKLLRQHFPPLAVLGADMEGWVYSGMRKGEPGKLWEPQVKIGQIRPLAAHALKYPEG